MGDTCPLCGYLMDLHTVLTENVVVNGQTGLKPVGWRCPVVEESKRVFTPPVPIEG